MPRKAFEQGTYVRSLKRPGQVACVQSRDHVWDFKQNPPRMVELRPSQTYVQWMVDTPDGLWGAETEIVPTSSLIEVRKVVTTTWVDVDR